jgi:hypothetical protein
VQVGKSSFSIADQASAKHPRLCVTRTNLKPFVPIFSQGCSFS